MPKVYKLSPGGLMKIIAAEKAAVLREMKKGKSSFGPVGDVTKKPKETQEIHPDELGTDKVHAKDIDQLKAQKVQEAKLLLQLKKLRESMRAGKRRIEERAAKKQPRK